MLDALIGLAVVLSIVVAVVVLDRLLKDFGEDPAESDQRVIRLHSS